MLGRWWSCVEGSSVKESGELIRLLALKAQGQGKVWSAFKLSALYCAGP